MDQLRYHIGLLAKHVDVQIALLMTPEFSQGLSPSLVGNEAGGVNVGLKSLQIGGNSMMPLIAFDGQSIVDRFPTHAEQFNQNINSQAMNAANLARETLDVLEVRRPARRRGIAGARPGQPLRKRAWPYASSPAAYEARCRGSSDLRDVQLRGLGRKGSRLPDLGARPVALVRQLDQLRIISPGLGRVAGEAGGACGAVEAGEPSRRPSQARLILAQGRLWAPQLEQELAELLARRKDGAGRDRMLLGGVVQVGRRSHQADSILASAFGLREPRFGDLPLDRHLRAPVVGAGRNGERAFDLA
jgi:hypothetical protein